MNVFKCLAVLAFLAAPAYAGGGDIVKQTCTAVESITGASYKCWSNQRQKEGLAYWSCRLSAAIKGNHDGRRCWRQLKN